MILWNFLFYMIKSLFKNDIFYYIIIILNRNGVDSMLAIYPGSFDPFHNGHLSILKRAAKMFDEIHILVANNSDKKHFFDLDQRVKIVNLSIIDGIGRSIIDSAKIEIVPFEGITAKYAKKHNAYAILRGIRNGTDLDYEFSRVEAYNRKVCPDTTTIYLTPEAKHLDTSSSLVRDFIKTKEYNCASEFLNKRATAYVKAVSQAK